MPVPRPHFMAKPGTVTGWKLGTADRSMLLAQFPPKYSDTVADHVTLRVGATPQTPLPRDVTARVIGRADDGQCLECLVVEIDGTTDRPDGSTYHITWSLGAGSQARESNDVLRDKGWDYIETPLDIALIPARF